MTFEVLLRKIGNSLGVVPSKEALGRPNAGDGDTLVFTECPRAGAALRNPGTFHD